MSIAGFFKSFFFNSPTLPPCFLLAGWGTGEPNHDGGEAVRCCKALPCTGLEHARGKMWKQSPAGLVLVLPTGLQQPAACSWHRDWLHLCAHGNWSPKLTLPQFMSLHPASKEMLEKQMHLGILCCNRGSYLFCALAYANFIFILQWVCINIIFVVMYIIFGDSSVYRSCNFNKPSVNLT